MLDYQVMPPLTEEEYAELKSDIEKRGVMVPIEYDEQGNVLDGHHRLQICAELGIKDFPKVIRAGMTEEEKRTHARKLNMARRQLNREQKQELIREQLRETPEKSDRQIGRELGVDNKTVAAQRIHLEAGEEIPHLGTTTGADGKEYPRQVERKPVTIFIPAEQEEIAPYFEEEEAANETFQETINRPHVANNSGNNEWYTPADYIEAAREVMGGIDIDPASNDIAQETVKAAVYYTAETNGLDKEWRGNVWMNPPYASDLIGKFIDKLVAELPNIEQAIVLVNNATETEWFGKLISRANAVCFPRSRVKFYMPDGKTGAPLQGQAVIYFGEHKERFAEVFGGKGWCAIPI